MCAHVAALNVEGREANGRERVFTTLLVEDWDLPPHEHEHTHAKPKTRAHEHAKPLESNGDRYKANGGHVARVANTCRKVVKHTYGTCG